MDVPDFDNLPVVEGMPQGCAWGVFDMPGEKDLVGTLNHLTPPVVQKAAAEVKDGVSISLNWPLNAVDHFPVPGRRSLEHTALPLPHFGGAGWDDEVTFNTQRSSQWDSLVHWQHQSTGLAYNGLKPTQESLSCDSTTTNEMPTLDHWHERGGMVGRGVLIDFKTYAEEHGVDFHPFNGYHISTEEIEKVAEHQGVEFRPGDIFILRTGITSLLAAPSPEDMAMLGKGQMSGVASTVESAKWFWNHKFAAVASDLMAFEAVSSSGAGEGGPKLVLHEHFLSLFGMPIGELWDLSKLAAYCKEHGRYSFMLTSAPLNVPCLVGSPPNALAIF